MTAASADRVALVTGASRGIGAHIVQALAGADHGLVVDQHHPDRHAVTAGTAWAAGTGKPARTR